MIYAKTRLRKIPKSCKVCNLSYENFCGEHTGYKDALFHTWVTETIFDGSIKTYAILELMEGSVIAEFPRNVRFLDSEERFFNKYFYEGE